MTDTFIIIGAFGLVALCVAGFIRGVIELNGFDV